MAEILPGMTVGTDGGMPEFNVEFEVFCANCGEGLCGKSTGGNSPRRGMPYVQVEPCPKCMINKYDEGHKDGYELAEKEISTII